MSRNCHITSCYVLPGTCVILGIRDFPLNGNLMNSPASKRKKAILVWKKELQGFGFD